MSTDLHYVIKENVTLEDFKNFNQEDWYTREGGNCFCEDAVYTLRYNFTNLPVNKYFREYYHGYSTDYLCDYSIMISIPKNLKDFSYIKHIFIYNNKNYKLCYGIFSSDFGGTHTLGVGTSFWNKLQGQYDMYWDIRLRLAYKRVMSLLPFFKEFEWEDVKKTEREIHFDFPIKPPCPCRDQSSEKGRKLRETYCVCPLCGKAL